MKVSSAFKFVLEYVRKRDIPKISPHEVLSRLGQPEFYIFDANLFSMWRRGHVPGAAYVGLDPYQPEMLPSKKSATLVFYCHSSICLASHMSAGRARRLGYRNVFVMSEGTKGWAELGFPLVSEVGSEIEPEAAP